MSAPLEPGQPAPDFTLPTNGGGQVRLSDFFGKKTVVLYFYPEDDTLGCTIESCTFRDVHQDFADAGAEVIGVSRDNVASHDHFRAKYQLPFTLASDPDGAVQRAYGAARAPLALRGRITFVIDRQGIIRDIYSSAFRVKEHVRRALELVRTLEREAR